MNDRGLTSTWWILKITLGLVPLLAGLDKFFNVLTNWTDYLNPAVLQVVPVTPESFLRGVGVVEMLVGLAMLTRWTRLGSYLAALWLTAIAASLFAMGRFYDVAVRDLVVAAAAFCLARLTAALRQTSAPPARARVERAEGGLLRLNL